MKMIMVKMKVALGPCAAGADPGTDAPPWVSAARLGVRSNS